MTALDQRLLRVRLGVGYDAPDACRLDLYRPADVPNAPLVVLLHGGYWTGGHRRQFRPCAEALAREGFAAATVGYRLLPNVAFPENLLDVLRGMACLVERAEEFGIDASRAVLWGSSAGGRSALLLGAGLEQWVARSGNPAVPEILGVFVQCPSADMPPETTRQALPAERREDPEYLRSMAPLHVPAGALRSVHITHGDADGTVPVSVSEALVKHLRTADVEAGLTVIAGADHGFAYDLAKMAGRQSFDVGLAYMRARFSLGQ